MGKLLLKKASGKVAPGGKASGKIAPAGKASGKDLEKLLLRKIASEKSLWKNCFWGKLLMKKSLENLLLGKLLMNKASGKIAPEENCL